MVVLISPCLIFIFDRAWSGPNFSLKYSFIPRDGVESLYKEGKRSPQFMLNYWEMGPTECVG